jgi:hypothetical protein
MFHRLLDAASHERSPGRDGGSDWFLTSVRFLDAIASTFGFDVQRVNDLADVT